MTEVTKLRAKVKWYNDEKGYGFLIVDGHPKDVFIHKAQLQKSNIESLQEGERLTCVVNQGPKGPNAADIARV